MASVPIVETPAKPRTPRRLARHRVEALMYVDLGPDNGGFPINISEDGMAFQGIRPLEANQEISITFKLDGTDGAVTATAKIVWLTESRKAGALQFTDFPEASRRAIREWISSQKPGDVARHEATLATSKLKGLGSPFASVTHAPDPNPSASPTHETPIAVKPLPDASQSTSEPARASASKVMPTAGPNAAKSLPLQHSGSSTDLKLSPRVPTLPCAVDHKSRWSSADGFRVAASIAILTFCGVILWPSREVLFHLLDHDRPAHTDTIPDPAPTAAPAVEQTPAEGSSTVLPVNLTPNEEPSQASPAASEQVANEQQDSALPFPPIVTTSVVSAPIVTKMNYERPVKLPLSARGLPARKLPTTPAKGEQPATVPSASVLEAKNEPQVTGDLAAKTTSPEPKPRIAPESPAGTIEIISDPYPSIRMPAQPNEKSSRLGTSLQIGRLISRVDPQYPAEALKQRIAGTVKVHIVIGQSGTVETAELVDGPMLLADAVLRAAQQWRYEPTLLGNAAIEVEEDITAVFKVTNSITSANY